MVDDRLVTAEREWRLALWSELADRNPHLRFQPMELKELRIVRGQQGIFRDKQRTAQISRDQAGIAVGVRHTGTRYPDELDDHGVLYHYPATGRGSRDDREVTAIRNCQELELPLFVVITPEDDQRVREVRLGWVEDMDDDSGVALVSFGETPPPTAEWQDVDGQPFSATADRHDRSTSSQSRPSQRKFRYRVFKRYGAACCLCGLERRELLNATHLHPVSESGTDDPRNGLPLCLNHHKALDDGLVAIEPTSLRVMRRDDLNQPTDIGISFCSLRHLRRKPHPDALKYLWKKHGSKVISTVVAAEH